MAHFAVSLRQVFEGASQWSNALPWYYTPKYILISVPIAVILGALIYPFVGGLKKSNRFTSFIVYFAFIFPIFWIVYSKANVYGGWRHAMFAYPPMVVAAGLGFNALVDFLKNKYLKIAATALPFLLLLLPLVHIIKNHPYEYVYFNELAGGTKKAYGQYELDYYYHSTRAASEWIIANAEKSGLETGDKIKVATWHTPSVAYFFRHDTAKFNVEFSRWYERGNNDWDYAIFVTTGINPVILRNGTYPPGNTVHTIEVDGVPIASILKRTDKKDYYGYVQMQAGNIDSAKILFKQSLEILPENESVLTNLANIYLQQGLFDSAIFYLNKFLAFEPNNESANYMAAISYYHKRDYNQALSYCKEVSRNNPKSSNGYSLAASVYLQMNDIYSAEKELLKLMDVGAFDQNAANQLINIYRSQGLNERVAQKKMFKHLAESYRKLGNKELADQYEEASRN
jgi:tetratricopeptide (TPR) repeat protein